MNRRGFCCFEYWQIVPPLSRETEHGNDEEHGLYPRRSPGKCTGGPYRDRGLAVSAAGCETLESVDTMEVSAPSSAGGGFTN